MLQAVHVVLMVLKWQAYKQINALFKLSLVIKKPSKGNQ
jgi:hypothetical protein